MSLFLVWVAADLQVGSFCFWPLFRTERGAVRNLSSALRSPFPTLLTIVSNSSSNTRETRKIPFPYFHATTALVCSVITERSPRMHMPFAISSPRTRYSVTKDLLRLALSLSLVLLAAAQASAQYGGGMGAPGTAGYVAPSSGYGWGKSDWHRRRRSGRRRGRALSRVPAPRRGFWLCAARRRRPALGGRKKQKVLRSRHQCTHSKAGSEMNPVPGLSKPKNWSRTSAPATRQRPSHRQWNAR